MVLASPILLINSTLSGENLEIHQQENKGAACKTLKMKGIYSPIEGLEIYHRDRFAFSPIQLLITYRIRF